MNSKKQIEFSDKNGNSVAVGKDIIDIATGITAVLLESCDTTNALVTGDVIDMFIEVLVRADCMFGDKESRDRMIKVLYKYSGTVEVQVLGTVLACTAAFDPSKDYDIFSFTDSVCKSYEDFINEKKKKAAGNTVVEEEEEPKVTTDIHSLVDKVVSGLMEAMVASGLPRAFVEDFVESARTCADNGENPTEEQINEIITNLMRKHNIVL